MKKEYVTPILLGLFLIGLVYFYISHISFSPKVDNTELILKEIKQLESKVEILSNKKDSIRIIIDSTNVKIERNEEHYEEMVNTILNNDDSTNLVWTRDYIKNYIKRLNK